MRKIFLLAIVGIFLINFIPATANCEYRDYSKVFNVSEEQGLSLKNFGVIISIDTESLISAGKLQEDCDDVLFNSTYGLLPWKNLTACNSSSTNFIVKMDLTRSSNNSFWFCYGNLTATNPNYDTDLSYNDATKNIENSLLGITFDAQNEQTIGFKEYGINVLMSAGGHNNAGTIGFEQYFSLGNSYVSTSNLSTNITRKITYGLNYNLDYLASVTEVWELSPWRPYAKVTFSASPSVAGDYGKGFFWSSTSNAVNYTNSSSSNGFSSTTNSQNNGNGNYAEGTEKISKKNGTNVWMDYRAGKYTGISSLSDFPLNNTYDAWARGTSWYCPSYSNACYGTGLHFNNQGTNQGPVTFYITSGNSSGNIDNFFSMNENPTIYFSGIEEVRGPIINFNSPENNFETNNSGINTNATISHPTGISNVSVYLDDVLNQTNSSGLYNLDYLFSIIGITDGIHSIKIGACDDSGICVNSSSRNFTIDTTAPEIQFVSPTYSGNYSKSFILANLTFSDIHLGMANITLYNSSGLVYTNASANSSFYVNISGLADGTYYLNASVNDTYGNENATSPIVIVIIQNPPIKINSPSGTITSLNVSLNFSVFANNDAPADTCIFWITRGASTEVSNTTITCNSTIIGNVAVTSDLTNYVIYFWMNDMAGRSNQINQSFMTNLAGSSGSSGSSGGFDDDDEEVVVVEERTCKKFEDAFGEWFEETEGQLLWERIKSGWKMILDLALCKSYASVFVIDIE